MSFFGQCRYTGCHQPRDLTEMQRKILGTLGWKFQGPCTGHPEWQHIQLPKGWYALLFANDSSTEYLTFFCDNRRRERVETHYVACRTKIRPFFTIDPCQPDRVAVVDGRGEIRYETSRPVDSNVYGPKSPAIIWLKKYYPKYEDPLAYWD